MTNCCAPHCTNNSKNGHSLIRFPKDEQMRRKWALKVRGNSDWIPTYHRICHVHFPKSDWLKYRGNLKPGVVPSVFPEMVFHGSSSPATFSEANSIVRDHEYSKKPILERVDSIPGWEISKYTPYEDHSYCKSTYSLHFPSCSDTADASTESLQSTPSTANLTTPPEVPFPASIDTSSVLDAENDKLREKLSLLKTAVGTLRQSLHRKKETIERLRQEKSKSENEAVIMRNVTQEIINKNEWVQGNFSPQQIRAALHGNSKGTKWDMQSVKKGLKIRFTGGSAGLETVIKEVAPLPSVRTLQRRVECIKFEPGLLHEILNPFSRQIAHFHPHDRDATLCFDAMSVKATSDFDTGSGRWIGGITLPGVTGQAHKMEVYMFAGIRQHWKLNAAYHFTPKEECAQGTSQVVLELLKTGEEMGLNTLALVCDMGNRGVLNSLGFLTTKAKRRFCIPNPANPKKVLYVVPDVAHVFKSLKEMFLNNRIIIIPENMVKKFNLPSNTVDLSHVEWLVSFQENMDVKFCPKLNKNDISKSHFNKMNVASARRVLNDKSGKALKYLAVKGICSNTYRTTAWFICFVDKWFTICTSRNLVHALSLRNKKAYDEAIEHLHDVINLFLLLKVGKGEWKPVQTHVVVATEALLEIQHHLLHEKGYQFVFLGRFLQDRVESLFAVVRIQRPVPSPRDAKYRLKQVTLSQCSQRVRKSSYDHDGDFFLVDLEDILKCINEKQNLETEEPLTVLPAWKTPTEYEIIGYKEEGAVVYRICGYMLHSLRSNGRLKCDDCFALLQHQGPKPLDIALWVTMTDYKEGAQIQVSRELFAMLGAIDFNLKLWKTLFPQTPKVKESVLKAIEGPSKNFHIPSCPLCPDKKQLLIDRFLDLRLKQISGNMSEKQKKKKSASELSSKSMGYRYLASNLNLTTQSEARSESLKGVAEKNQQRSPPKKRLRRLVMST